MRGGTEDIDVHVFPEDHRRVSRGPPSVSGDHPRVSRGPPTCFRGTTTCFRRTTTCFRRTTTCFRGTTTCFRRNTTCFWGTTHVFPGDHPRVSGGPPRISGAHLVVREPSATILKKRPRPQSSVLSLSHKEISVFGNGMRMRGGVFLKTLFLYAEVNFFTTRNHLSGHEHVDCTYTVQCTMYKCIVSTAQAQ